MSPPAPHRQSDYGYYDETHRSMDYASTSLPYELSLPVERPAGLYCMTLTFKGFLPGASTCYNLLSTAGGYLTMDVREWMGVRTTSSDDEGKYKL